MAAGILDLLYILNKNRVNWNTECLYTKETSYSFKNQGYKISKATSINELFSATDEDVVLLYTGDNVDIDNEIKNGIATESSKNFVAVVINDTTLKVVKKTEFLSVGDIDMPVYNYEVVRDLSKEWIRYQLRNDKTYKTRIMSSIENNKKTVKQNLKDDRSLISEEIAQLKRKKLEAIKTANQDIKKYKDLKKLVSSIDKEF